MEIRETKICRICGLEKPLTNFPIVRKLKSGHRQRRTMCRSCSNYGTGNNIKRSKKKRILEEANYKCYYCGEYGDTVDHIEKGNNSYNMLLCACVKCNSSRGDMSVEDFKRLKQKVIKN